MQDAAPTLGQATRVWARIALHSFGGPAAQIAVMHRVLVDELKWIGERRFLGALNYCMLLPGPEAQQLVTYLGWILHGWRGGMLAGGLFVLPGFVTLGALSMLYVAGQQLPLLTAAMGAVKVAIIAIVVEAMLRVAKRALKHNVDRALAVVSCAALLLDVPFPAVLLAAGLFGYFRPARNAGSDEPDDALIDHILARTKPARLEPNVRRAFATAALWLSLWWAPVLAVLLLLGPENVFSRVALFFSGAAMVTFGGAYSVLAYVAQEAVETWHWLAPGEMLDGLALAETTPGPLIQVVQFVGFLATYRDPGTLPPWLAGLLGSLLTCWVTFVPSLLWIFVGAPWIESARRNERWQGALRGISAAVVGVIANLALWSAWHTVHSWVDAVVLAAALLATFRFHVGMFSMLGGAAVFGMIRYGLGL